MGMERGARTWKMVGPELARGLKGGAFTPLTAGRAVRKSFRIPARSGVRALPMAPIKVGPCSRQRDVTKQAASKLGPYQGN